MGEFSLSHILIVAIVVLVFFGPSRLPAAAKSLGEAIRDFKKALNAEDPKKQIDDSASGNVKTEPTEKQKHS